MATSVEPQYEKKPNTLYIKGIPMTYNEDRLRQLFSPFGFIISIRIMRNECVHKNMTTTGFVSFDNIRSADNAMNTMNKCIVDNNVFVITKAKRKVKNNIENSLQNKFANSLQNNIESSLQNKFANSLQNNIENSLQNKFANCFLNLNDCNSVNDYKSNTTINDLDDLLTKVFDFLTIKQKFGVSRVCKLWKDFIIKSMPKEKVLTFGKTNRNFYYGCSDSGHEVNDYNDLSDAIITADNNYVFRSLTQLAPIVRLTQNIECLQFANCFVDTITLKWIITQSPKLKCLRFDNIEGIAKLDWPKLGKPLSSINLIVIQILISLRFNFNTKTQLFNCFFYYLL
jgi:RNA recognition motif-containing protein